MSLTKEQWEDLYKSAKKIDRLADYLYFRNRARANDLKDEARFIKDLVESVIGQQE